MDLEQKICKALHIHQSQDGQYWITDTDIQQLPAAIVRALKVAAEEGAIHAAALIEDRMVLDDIDWSAVIGAMVSYKTAGR